MNVEDSPITKVGEENFKQRKRSIDEDDDDILGNEANIGMYMKAGYCYCDIKSFVPMVVCMTLVALWFSDHKSKGANSKIKNVKNFY